MDRNEKHTLITDWEEQRAILKEKFKKLGISTMDFTGNERNEMLEKLALQFGITSTEIRRIINHFIR